MDLDKFTLSYIETALSSSSDESDDKGGSPLDENYSIKDIAPEAMAKMKAECAKFQADNAALIVAENCNERFDGPEQHAGYHFWLTRNRYGAGFWDGDWEEAVGERLTEAAHAFGECDLYIGDDGLIYAT